MSRQDAFAETARAEHFVQQCRVELKLYPRSPVIFEPQTARDIDLSNIFRMTPDQIDEALRLEAAA